MTNQRSSYLSFNWLHARPLIAGFFYRLRLNPLKSLIKLNFIAGQAGRSYRPVSGNWLAGKRVFSHYLPMNLNRILITERVQCSYIITTLLPIIASDDGTFFAYYKLTATLEGHQ